MTLAQLAAVFFHAAQAKRGLTELERLQARGVDRFAVILVPNYVARPTPGRNDDAHHRLPIYGRPTLDGRAPPVVVDATDARTLAITLVSRNPNVSDARIDADICRPDVIDLRRPGAAERGVDLVMHCPTLSAIEAKLLLRSRINQAHSPATARTLNKRLIDPVVGEVARGRVRADEAEDHRLHLTEVVWRVLCDFTDPERHPPACDIRSAAVLAGRRETNRFLHRRRYGSVPTGTALAHIVARLAGPDAPAAGAGDLSADDWRADFIHHRSGRGDIPSLDHWERARAIASGAGSGRVISLDHSGPTGSNPPSADSPAPSADDDRADPYELMRARPMAVDAAAVHEARQGAALRLLREIRRGRALTPRLIADLERADPVQARRWPGHHPAMSEPYWIEAEQIAVGELLSHGLDDALLALRSASYRARSLAGSGESGHAQARRVLDQAARDLH